MGLINNLIVIIYIVLNEYVITLKKNMVEKSIRQKFRLKNKDEARNYFLEAKKTKCIDGQHKKLCTAVNYIEHFVIMASAVTECASTSAFASLIDFPGGTTSSAMGLKICSMTAIIKKFKSINKKRGNMMK